MYTELSFYSFRRQELGLPDSVQLLPKSKEDADEASAIAFRNEHNAALSRRHKRHAILASSIFPQQTQISQTNRSTVSSKDGALVGKHIKGSEKKSAFRAVGVKKKKTSVMDRASAIARRQRLDPSVRLKFSSPN